MATQLQIRRGTSTQVAAFTGAEGEIVVNTTNDSVHVNDGSTAGGFEMARVDGSNWNVTNNISTTGSLTAASLVVDTTTLVVDATNNRVGIGTSSASTKLHLGGTAPGDSIIRQDSTVSGTNWEIGEREAGKWQIFEDDSDSIVATFMSSGNFGIGNSSPDSVLTAVNAASTAALRIGLNNTSFNYMDADNNIFRSGAGTERMRISGGNLLLQQTSAAVYDSNTSGDVSNFWKMSASGASTATRSIIGSNTTGGIFGGTRLNTGGTRPIITAFMEFSCPDTTAGAETGEIYFYTKPSGGVASSTKRIIIDSSGRQIIGHTASVGTAYQTNLQVKGSTASNYPGLGVISTNNEMLGVVGTWSNGENSLMIAADPDNLRPSSSIVFTTDATERMRIDSTSIKPKVPVEIGSSSYFLGNATHGYRFNNAADTSNLMILQDSGNLLLSTTFFHDSNGAQIVNHYDFPKTGIEMKSDASSAAHFAMTFRNPNGLVGNITTTGSATSFNTSSDQRLKENIVDAPSASDDIDAIQVRSFDWKADGSHQKYGMVAQELNTVAPEAVSAPEDPNEMMGIDYSKLVPMLVKEIQSLRARVNALEAE